MHWWPARNKPHSRASCSPSWRTSHSTSSQARYEYSNSDNVTVGLMVEAATGTSYEEQLRERVFRPLGLKKTSLPRGPNLRKPFIHGYDNDPSQQPPDDLSEVLASGWFWASGGMVTTPSDLNAFVRGYVGGDLFDLKTRARQRKVFEGSLRSSWPWEELGGLRHLPLRDEVRDGVGPHGQLPGYTQFLAASPDGKRRRLRCRSTSS